MQRLKSFQTQWGSARKHPENLWNWGKGTVPSLQLRMAIQNFLEHLSGRLHLVCTQNCIWKFYKWILNNASATNVESLTSNQKKCCAQHFWRMFPRAFDQDEKSWDSFNWYCIFTARNWTLNLVVQYEIKINMLIALKLKPRNNKKIGK